MPAFFAALPYVISAASALTVRAATIGIRQGVNKIKSAVPKTATPRTTLPGVTGAGIGGGVKSELTRRSLKIAEKFSPDHIAPVLTQAALETAKVNAEFTRLAVNVNMSLENIEELKEKIFDIAQSKDISLHPDKLTKAYAFITAKTGDGVFAENNLRNIGLLTQATGANPEKIGAFLNTLRNLGIVAEQDVLQALDRLKGVGEKGALSLANLIEMDQGLIRSFTGGAENKATAIAELQAMMQVISTKTGNSDITTGAFRALSSVLDNPLQWKQLQDAGLKIYDEDGVRRSNADLATEIINDLNSGESKYYKFLPGQVQRTFSGIEDYQVKLDGYLNQKAESSIKDDAIKNAKTAQAQLENIYTGEKVIYQNIFGNAVNKIGESLYGTDKKTKESISSTLTLARVAGGMDNQTAMWTTILGGAAVQGITGFLDDFYSLLDDGVDAPDEKFKSSKPIYYRGSFSDQRDISKAEIKVSVENGAPKVSIIESENTNIKIDGYSMYEAIA